MKVLPHVAQNTSNRSSAVPDHIPASEGYVISKQKQKQKRKRKLIVSGWAWHIDMTRRFADHRGHGEFDNNDVWCGDWPIGPLGAQLRCRRLWRRKLNRFVALARRRGLGLRARCAIDEAATPQCGFQLGRQSARLEVGITEFQIAKSVQRNPAHAGREAGFADQYFSSLLGDINPHSV